MENGWIPRRTNLMYVINERPPSTAQGGGNERRIAETKRASYSCVPPLPTFCMASRPDILCGRIAPATRGDKSGVSVRLASLFPPESPTRDEGLRVLAGAKMSQENRAHRAASSTPTPERVRDEAIRLWVVSGYSAPTRESQTNETCNTLPHPLAPIAPTH